MSSAAVVTGALRVNPFLGGYPFWGHRQTVQTQFRGCKTGCLILLYAACLLECLCKIQERQKHSPETSQTRHGFIQMIRMDMSNGQKRVKRTVILLQCDLKGKQNHWSKVVVLLSFYIYLTLKAPHQNCSR